MNMGPLVSVIVPVYNAEKTYLDAFNPFKYNPIRTWKSFLLMTVQPIIVLIFAMLLLPMISGFMLFIRRIAVYLMLEIPEFPWQQEIIFALLIRTTG